MIQDWNPTATVIKWGVPGAGMIDTPLLLKEGDKIGVWIAGDDRLAKERLAQITYAMGLNPFDSGPLRMARDIEASVRLYMVPWVQWRSETWEYVLHRTNDFPCQDWWGGDWYKPVSDADNLPDFPSDGGLTTCSSE
jgi:hypothetical protein